MAKKTVKKKRYLIKSLSGGKIICHGDVIATDAGKARKKVKKQGIEDPFLEVLDTEPFENTMPNTITFIASSSGDGECFFWRLADQEQAKTVLGEDYNRDRDDEIELAREMAEMRGVEFKEEVVDQAMLALYPTTILQKLGCADGKNYKFTVTVEEVE